MSKITRGISEEFAQKFIESDLYKFYQDNKDELFLGVRNNYLNLYYNCDSIAKIQYTNGQLISVMDRYYFDGIHRKVSNKDKFIRTCQNQIIKNYSTLKENSNKKTSAEKKAQSKLVCLNNNNPNSNWYCFDIEYVKAFKNQKEKRDANFNGRFDIMAISKEKPHRIALIELKYGNGAIGGKSGIHKHVSDFIQFTDQQYFEKHVRNEIIEVLKSHKNLKLDIPFPIPNSKDLLQPEFYFITLNNNAQSSKGYTPKQTMAGYLFKEKRWGCKRLTTKISVEADFGDITKRSNKFYATFLFSSQTVDNITIKDIIDGNYDDRILPT